MSDLLKKKIPIEPVSDTMILLFEGLNRDSLSIKTDHTKYSKSANNIVTLDNVFNNYFKKYMRIFPLSDHKQAIRHSIYDAHRKNPLLS